MDMTEIELGLIVRHKSYCQPLMVVGLDRNTEYAEVLPATKTHDGWRAVPDPAKRTFMGAAFILKHTGGM